MTLLKIHHLNLLDLSLCALPRGACSSWHAALGITPVSALLWGKPDRDRLAAVDCKHGGVHSYRAVPNIPLLLV